MACLLLLALAFVPADGERMLVPEERLVPVAAECVSPLGAPALRGEPERLVFVDAAWSNQCDRGWFRLENASGAPLLVRAATARVPAIRDGRPGVGDDWTLYEDFDSEWSRPVAAILPAGSAWRFEARIPLVSEDAPGVVMVRRNNERAWRRLESNVVPRSAWPHLAPAVASAPEPQLHFLGCFGSNQEALARVRLENGTTEAVRYFGPLKPGFEVWTGAAFEDVRIGWCSTGMEWMTLGPGEFVIAELPLRADRRRGRCYAAVAGRRCVTAEFDPPERFNLIPVEARGALTPALHRAGMVREDMDCLPMRFDNPLAVPVRIAAESQHEVAWVAASAAGEARGSAAQEPGVLVPPGRSFSFTVFLGFAKRGPLRIAVDVLPEGAAAQARIWSSLIDEELYRIE